mgnify:CR=1 FL=1
MSDVTSRAWWRWMPGMRDTRGCRLTDRGSWDMPDGWDAAAFAADGYAHHPDAEDPATLGCLTQRARELWGDPRLHVTPHPVRGLWYAHDREGRVVATGPTEFAALLAACDAAPGGAT